MKNTWTTVFIGTLVLALVVGPLAAEAGFSEKFFAGPTDDNHGGIACAACVVVLDLVEQLAELHVQPVEQVLDKFCSYLPTPVSDACVDFVNTYGQYIIDGFVSAQNADDICLEINLCTGPATDQCRLLPKAGVSPDYDTFRKRAPVKTNLKTFPWPPNKSRMPTLPKESPWQWLMDLINRLAQHHEPIFDVDTDNFSTERSLRGSNWRGADCNDLDSKVYPGRQQNPYKGSGVDYNCNGIRGLTPQGQEWEDVLCANTGMQGVVVMGDSAGAHFEIPPAYMTPSEINESTYKDIINVLSNELDKPHRSGYTGWENSTSSYQVRSLYKYMYERNRCNFRDYQNLAVNGMRSGPVTTNMAIARNNQTDYPVLAVLELIGNDICTPHHTLDMMTTPQQFYTNIMQFLNWFDTQVPANSHLVIFGIVDGRILFDLLHNRTHPIGVTYERVYNFLNCHDVNPCWAWLNSNETIRNAGSARAAELNQVYRQILSNTTFKNFDMAYYDFPAEEILTSWEKAGGNPALLIEPIDGFHPGQQFNALLADWLFAKLGKEHPTFIGSVNPNNAKIQQMFGNQGGY